MLQLTRSLQVLLARTSVDQTGDAELLHRWVRQHDQAAFELLVWRYAGFVLGLSRQILRDEQHAEDAFQATFLVLFRRAASISRAESLPGWLHRVATRIALRARQQCPRLATVDSLDETPTPGNDAPGLDADQRCALHEEVQRLPAKYRLPVVSCYLQGKTHEETAQELGWPRGTVAGRLARARDLLRRRLIRRGLAPTALLGAWLEPMSSLSALPPQGLVTRTMQSLFSPGNPLPPAVLTLARGVIEHMVWISTQRTVALVLCLGLAGLGVTFGTVRALSDPPKDPDSGEVRSHPREETPKSKTQAITGDLLPIERERAQIRESLKQLGIASHHHVDTTQSFARPASVDAKGQPLLSWRVHLLPYMGQEKLYRQFNLNERWDSPHNRKLIEKMPAVFAPPASVKTPQPGMTYYQYIVGPGAIFTSHATVRLGGGGPGAGGGMMPGFLGGSGGNIGFEGGGGFGGGSVAPGASGTGSPGKFAPTPGAGPPLLGGPMGGDGSPPGAGLPGGAALPRAGLGGARSGPGGGTPPYGSDGGESVSGGAAPLPSGVEINWPVPGGGTAGPPPGGGIGGPVPGGGGIGGPIPGGGGIGGPVPGGVGIGAPPTGTGGGGTMRGAMGGGLGGIMGGVPAGSIYSIIDGTSNTLLIVEAANPVIWTKPEDVAFHPQRPLPKLGGHLGRVFHALTADGAVHVFSTESDGHVLRAAISRAGGEVMDLKQLRVGSRGVGSARRTEALNRLEDRNRQLQEEAIELKKILAEMKEEMDNLRWSLAEEKLLESDPKALQLRKANAELEQSLRETREEARKMLQELERMKGQLRKQGK